VSSVALTVFYAKGIRIALKNRTFKEAMHLIWESPAFCEYDPLKMVFTTTGKVLFMDKNAFHSYLNGNLTMGELIELTECDELYRNKQDFTSENGFVVDAGALWKAHRKELTLIDDDISCSTILDLTIFEIAE
jgi:hypothetical protein